MIQVLMNLWFIDPELLHSHQSAAHHQSLELMKLNGLAVRRCVIQYLHVEEEVSGEARAVPLLFLLS